MRIKWFSLVRITGLLLVLLYHFFQSVFTGGFIGVDIFFTFSGFLITALLIDEFARSGKIDIMGYLRRRFYRIFPPLVLMILLVMPLTLLIRQDYVAGIGLQIMASLGFVTNIFEIISGGNYESQFIPHLFVHTWSLAVEVHYYLFWGIGLWFLSKRSKNKGAFRGSVFLLSSGLFFLSFLAMFISAFSATEFSGIYFSSLTHVFPFFLGSTLATMTGVTNTTPLLARLKKAWTLQQTLLLLAGSALGLVILTFLLKFTHISTYLVGFLLASLFTGGMILGARLLHEKTETIKELAVVNFIADTSYGVYLFHWPLYLILGQLMSNAWAALLTTFLSVALAALSFYIIEPVLAGKKAKIFGTSMDLSPYLKPLSWILLPLTLLTLGIMLFSPSVGSFEQSLTVEALNQADSKMQQTRSNVDQAKATDYNVTAGNSLIGDSVALRASEYLKAALPEIDVDASVSRNLETGMEVYNNSISNHVLKQNIIIALGTNTVDNYKEQLDKLVENLPKGHRLILVTPYDGRVAGDSSSISDLTRQYELELASKYDYVTIADWYQTALDNPGIWSGTDNVHFGSTSETIAQGGELYANTIKGAVDAVQDGPVKP